MDDLPCDLKTLLSFDFKNLIEVISFLHRNAININVKLTSLSEKLTILTPLKDEMEAMKLQAQVHSKKIGALDETVQHYQRNFLELNAATANTATQIQSLQDKLVSLEESANASGDKLAAHEQNLNNLNRIVEENIKDFEREKAKMEQYHDNIIDLENSCKYLKEDITAMNEKAEQNIHKLNTTIELTREQSKENHSATMKKIDDVEKNVTSIIQQVSTNKDFAKHLQEQLQLQQKQIYLRKEEHSANDNAHVAASSNNNNNNVKGSAEASQDKQKQTTNAIDDGASIHSITIENLGHKVSTLMKTADLLRIQHSQDITDINSKLKDIEASIKDILDKDPFDPLRIRQLTQDKDDENSESSQRAKLNEVTLSFMQKLSDSTKQLNADLDKKTDKTETELIKKVLNDLSEKLKNTIILYDTKFSSLSYSVGANGSSLPLDVEMFMENVEVKVNEILANKAHDLIQQEINSIDLSNNPNFAEMFNCVSKHSSELDKAFESIVDIRKNLLDKAIEEKVAEIQTRIEDDETTITELKEHVDDLLKTISSSKAYAPSDGTKGSHGSDALENVAASLKEHVNLISNKVTALTNAVEKLEKRMDNLNKDILLIIKKDLKNESTRILDEFKQDLRISIAKIEEQLRNKVDKFGLMEFGQKIDTRFSKEIKSKIDKSDLNKNNHAINRKIDSLENKISKTLVDTLIDLQLDEAPLIVKKNTKNVEHCASCNQPLLKSMPTAYFTRYNGTSFKFTKLPEINP